MSHAFNTYITYFNVSTGVSNSWIVVLKGTKREKLHAMHVKQLIKTNYSEW